MYLDKSLRELWIRGRAEYELYLKDLVRDGVALDQEHAKAIVERKHVAVPLTGKQHGGLMYGEDVPVWFGE